MEILVNVIGQKLKIATNLKCFISGSQQFVKFTFNMDDSWDNLQTFAQFRQNDVAYNQYLDANNSVYLPREIGAGTCTLILYGTGGNVRATTNYLTLTIDENILVTNAQSTEITQSLYEQLVNSVTTTTNRLQDRVANVENVIQGLAGGAPIVVASTSGMTDTAQIYVLSTDGMWYYHNGATWVAGGEYGGVANGSVTTDKLANGAVTTAKIADGAVTAGKIASGVVPPVDATLTQAGAIADAKAVGDRLAIAEGLREVLADTVTAGGGTAYLGTWAQGSITATGAPSTHSRRIRTEFIQVFRGCLIHIQDGYSFKVHAYSAPNTAGYEGAVTDFISGEYFADAGHNYIKVVVMKDDDTAITPEDTSGYVDITVYGLTDNTLTIRNMPADALYTGRSISNLASNTLYDVGYRFSAWVVGSGINISTGAVISSSKLARSSVFLPKARAAVLLTNSNYMIAVSTYSATSARAANHIASYGWCGSGVVIPIDQRAASFVFQVKRVDGEAITTDDVTALSTDVIIYRPTDTSLSFENTAADAKAVGDSIASIRAAVLDTGTFYSIPDNDLGISKTVDELTSTELFGLYDALVSAYPDYVTKNTLTSGSFENYEYVFTLGNYNSKNGRRDQDGAIAKPVILLVSGVHGREKASVVAVYRLMRSLCENDYRLSELIGATIKVIPLACPWGFNFNPTIDTQGRTNANGVNINRNFATSTWSKSGEGGTDFSGDAPGDQPETQIVQNWITANSTAAFYIDYHNSAYTNEVSSLVGTDSAGSMAFKIAALQGVNKVIPFWRKSRGMLSTNHIYAYSGGTDVIGQTSRSYANEAGIARAYTFETSNNIMGTGRDSDATVSVGAEALGNLLIGVKKFYTLGGDS